MGPLNDGNFLTFFAVLTRFSVLVSVLPFVGDRMIPIPVKILLSLAISICLYPVLVATGQIKPDDAMVWASTAGGIVRTIGQETLFGLAIGFCARIIFDVVAMGGDLIGNFMGFAAASQYDPHQETQTQIVARILTGFAMLTFLAVDGHHLMLNAALNSYQIVPIGKLQIGAEFGQKILSLSASVIRVGLQMSGPMAISFFGINVVYGVMAKAMPQLNILVLSFSVSALLGLFILHASLPGFVDLLKGMFGTMDHQMVGAMKALTMR